MSDWSHLKTLKTAELAKRLNDLRISLLPVLNEGTLVLLEEIERRLGGGGPLTPIEQLPKKEQELRRQYEFYKSFASRPERKNAAMPGLFRSIDPYEEWKAKHLKYEREQARESRNYEKNLSQDFPRKVEKYLRKKKDNINLDINFKVADRFIESVSDEIDILKKNQRNRDLLQQALNISNLDDPSWEDKTKYWLISTERYEKPKKDKK